MTFENRNKNQNVPGRILELTLMYLESFKEDSRTGIEESKRNLKRSI